MHRPDSGPEHLDPATWLVSGGRDDSAGAPLNVPPVPASNFVPGGASAYARDGGTPTWHAFEDIVGGLEQGEALAFASGMAAIAAVFSLLPGRAHVVIPDDCYQGVASLARAGAEAGRWSLQRLAVEETGAWIAACGEADLVWLESPTNPLLTVADLPAIAAAPRRRGTLLAVDNTFATPLNQQPLALGADIAIQSATKFIGGHSDLLAGVAVTRDAALRQRLATAREVQGATPGALEMFLAVRGLRTLALRTERAQHNAMQLAQRLAGHDAVTTVRYPGLATHPTHATARRVLRGFGSMLSFDVAGGAAAADRACRDLRIIRHATSLGGVESTIERRAAVAGQEHLPPGLLRLSVGIEAVDDLWDDLDRTLCGTAP